MAKSMLLSLLLITPAFGQSMYKCPSPIAGAPPVFQQMPCTPTGGGETVEKKEIKTTGTDARINEQGLEYMKQNNERWTAQQKAQAKEAERQEALNVERDKAKAAQEQAAAQRATAAAIYSTGHR